MTRAALLLGALLPAAAACTGPETEPAGTVHSWGSVREAIRDGQSQARVRVADVLGPHVYGVGAAEQLTGEITLIDGSVWLSTPVGDEVITRRSADIDATMLFAARVPTWVEIEVRESIEPGDFDQFLEDSAKSLDLDPATPLPFVIRGPLRDVRAHVIAGDCPIRALHHGEEPDPPPYEISLDGAPGTLVGIFATDAGGELMHHGTSTHTHVVLEEGGRELTAHVESVGLEAGAVLRLPDRR